MNDETYSANHSTRFIFNFTKTASALFDVAMEQSNS